MFKPDKHASFKATVESYRDPMMMRDTVRVLIERTPQASEVPYE